METRAAVAFEAEKPLSIEVRGGYSLIQISKGSFRYSPSAKSASPTQKLFSIGSTTSPFFRRPTYMQNTCGGHYRGGFLYW